MDILKYSRNNQNSQPNTVSIRPLAKKDIHNVIRWMTSSYVLQHSFVVLSPKIIPHDFATSQYAKRYFNLLREDARRKTFVINYKTWPIGTVGLKDIDARKQRAECFIEIGDAAYRGRGIGNLAMRQILDIAFSKLCLHQIDLDVLEFNAPAIKTYHRLGFKSQPSTSWHYDEFGQYWKVMRMSLIEEHYQKPSHNLLESLIL